MTAIDRRSLLLAAAATPAVSALALDRSLTAGALADPWSRVPEILARIRPPSFPPNEFDITRFGALPDGATLATDSIAAAIAECAAAGGGRVLVPAGTFLTGAVRLRSGVELHLSEGARLLFSPDPAHYPIVHTRLAGTELLNYSPFVFAYREKNVALTGRGMVDGQADQVNWWPWKGRKGGHLDFGWRPGMPSQDPGRLRLEEMDDAGVPLEQRVFGDGYYLRPPLIQFYDCRNVLIEDVRLRRSPSWQIHPVLTENLTVRGVDLSSHGPNNDGCNPESCRDVLIENVTFDCGDDCIAVKSGRGEDGRRIARPSEDIVIRGCDFRDGHAGICIGSEIAGGARRIFGENCRMDSENLWYALRFKNNAQRGGVLEDFHFRDLEVGRVSRAAMTCDFNYDEGGEGHLIPVLRDITVQRLHVAAARRVVDIQGLPNAPIERISLSDCRFEGVSEPSILRHVQHLELTNVRINGSPTDAL